MAAGAEAAVGGPQNVRLRYAWREAARMGAGRLCGCGGGLVAATSHARGHTSGPQGWGRVRAWVHQR